MSESSVTVREPAVGEDVIVLDADRGRWMLNSRTGRWYHPGWITERSWAWLEAHEGPMRVYRLACDE